jgi:hypothetical protein
VIRHDLDQTWICMFLCFLWACQCFFCWQDLDIRQTDVYFFAVCF